MRSLLTIGCLTAFIAVGLASEPKAVSVHPPKPLPAAETPVMPNVVSGSLVLEGTLVPATSTPSAEVIVEGTGLKTAPTVPCPEMKACESKWFGGSLLATGCNVCESPGRPSPFTGMFQKPLLLLPAKECSSCEPTTCETKTCQTCTPACGTPAWPQAGGTWDRFKSWLCWERCDGPRVGWLKFESYRPANFATMPCKTPNYGTCPSGHCGSGRPGLGVGSGMAAGANGGTAGCADGSCRNGLGLGHRKGPQDCNGAEPQLSGQHLVDNYRFATILPKSYGQNVSKIDPIMGTVKAPGEDLTAVQPTAIEQASGIAPLNGPKGVVKPKAATTHTGRLTTPFSTP
jgi:hypothetical protein